MKKIILTIGFYLATALFAVDPNQFPILGWGVLDYLPEHSKTPEFYEETPLLVITLP